MLSNSSHRDDASQSTNMAMRSTKTMAEGNNTLTSLKMTEGMNATMTTIDGSERV